MSSIFRKIQEKPEIIPQRDHLTSSWEFVPSSSTVPQTGNPLASLDINAQKGIERQNCTQRALDTYKPYFLEYSLMGEYVLLQKQHISGAYVLPSSGSPLKWFGVLFIRQGLYQGGIFRFTLYIPDNFPDCGCPILVFEPSIFHPLINMETGELDVKRNFSKWRRNSCHLWHVIQYARKIFYKIETQAPLNQEAANLYEKDLELYKLKIAENMNLSHEILYEKPLTEDNHAIWFCPWNPSVHEEMRQKLLTPQAKFHFNQEESPKELSNGLSWIQKGLSNVFSKKEL